MKNDANQVLDRAYEALVRCELKEREHQAWQQRHEDVRDESARAWHRKHRERIERERGRDEREGRWQSEQSQPKAPNIETCADVTVRTVDEAIYARNLVDHDYLWRNLDRLVGVIAEECGRCEKQVRGDFVACDAELRALAQGLAERIGTLEALVADQQALLDALASDAVDNNEET